MSDLHWMHNFEVTDEELDFIMNTMLEQETPMTTRELTTMIIERRLDAERADLEAKFQDTAIYNPAKSYDIGDRLVFTQLGLATATVTDMRAGDNDEYGAFDVITVTFDDDTGDQAHQYAASLTTPHKLADANGDHPISDASGMSVRDVLEATDGEVLYIMRDALRDYEALRRVAGYWFPAELVLEFDIGTLHLSEAVLDMNGGGPMTTETIIEQIGGLGESPLQLQVFSLNMALNDDDRFSEVGPAGEVMWYLDRMMPDPVRGIPERLRYEPIEYDEEALSDEMFDLETELDDEYTPIEFEGRLKKATSTLLYPHRREGTLPLNAKTRSIFPRARTPRIYVELVDGIDGDTYDGWVVHEHKYVYGLQDYYEKHEIPVGAYVSIARGDHPGQIVVSHEAYKPRTEYVTILSVKGNQLQFEAKKRAIGAEYDEFILLGVDEIEAIDKAAKAYARRSLNSILREILGSMSKLTPQGTVHAITLYSVINVVRRCAPGPIFATLTESHEFEEMGSQYWTLAETD
jgi:hypothetical protein